MLKVCAILIVCLFLTSCQDKNQEIAQKSNQEETIETYLKNGAWKHHYLTKEWDEWVTKGLEEDPTIAYLWQQKALPFWKQKKYQQAITYYEKAIALDREKWLSRLGFLKCIFAKDYQGAIKDLTAHNKEFGSTYEQNHLLELYIGIAHLQLNQYDEALELLNQNIDKIELEQGADWVNSLDRFYLGIAYYELNDYTKAIVEFNKALKDYPTFSDVQFYKSICLKYMGRENEAKVLMDEAITNFNNGYTFGEDSALYEDYPYQVTWQWGAASALIKKST